MQLATALTYRKPLQRNRFGEILEGPSGSESVACSERSTKNLGDPPTSSFCFTRGKADQPKGDCLMGKTKWRESDHFIVLRDGRADHMGKGMTVLRNPQRKLVPDMKGWIMQANLTEEFNNGSHC